MMIEKVRVKDISGLSDLVDTEQNSIDGIDSLLLSVNSNKTIHWKCKKGHTFEEKVYVMYRRKNKCFFCTGRQVWPGENDLQTLYPELAEEFDAAKNGITPNYISPKDSKSYVWTCRNNHPSFIQSVEHRINRKTKCPYCTGRKVISGKTDLASVFPEIASEWDYEKNKGITPREVSPFSYVSYYWICPKGHSYKKKVIKRTKEHKPVDCPKCVKASSTSFPEQAIFYYVKKCYPDAVNRFKDPFENGMELDIYIPSLKIGIEYDGIAFHKSDEQHQREYKKYIACKKLGIRLVRIKESKDTWTDTADNIFYVDKRMNDEKLSSFIRFFFGDIFSIHMYLYRRENQMEEFLNKVTGFPTDFDISRDRPEILEYLVDVDHSFGTQYPEQAKLWDDKANGNLTPYMFTPGSNYEAALKCPQCGNKWKSPIASITSRRVKKCKKCSMKENGKTITRVKMLKNGCLAEKGEVLLKQWDVDKNDNISPYEIPVNYSRNVDWKCDVCGYSWSSSPNSRYRNGNVSGCPHCAGRVPMLGLDDFEHCYPDLAQEWDYENNGGVLPSQIKSHTNKKYNWICPACKKSYPSLPGNRIAGHGCPDCARLKVGKMNSKRVGKFDDKGDLIEEFQGLHQAAKVMGVVPNSIFQAIKNGRKSRGYYWRYLP